MKLKAVRSSCDTTLPNTARPGKKTIAAELDSLNQDWEGYGKTLAETEEGLKSKLASWDQYEAAHKALSQWVKSKEGELKEYGLKSTLAEKQAQVTKLQVSCRLYNQSCS